MEKLMAKDNVDIDELIKELRNKYRAYVATDNEKPGRIFSIAADVIEEYKRRDKFNAFVWKTLGTDQMRQLVEMYQEEQDGGSMYPGWRWRDD